MGYHSALIPEASNVSPAQADRIAVRLLCDRNTHFKNPFGVREPILWVLAAITIIGAALRVTFVFQPMRYDESYTYITYVARPLRTSISYYNCPNNHIFHTLMARECIAMFGAHPWVLRLPALIFGTLMIPAAFFMAAAFFGPNVAILTSALTASSSILVEYSTNARGYTIECVCFLMILAIAKSLTLKSGATRWRLFSVLSALGFYAIPVMLFPFGIVVVWMILDWLAKDAHSRDPQLPVRLLSSIALTTVIVFVLYIPVLANTGWRSLVANRFITPQSGFLLKLLRYLASTWTLAVRDLPAPLIVVLILGIGMSAFVAQPSRGAALRLLAAVVLWSSTVLVTMRAVPDERVWLFALPLFFALSLDGLRILASSIPSRMVLVAPLLVAVLGYRTIYSGSILNSRETGALPDGQAITLSLKPFLSEKCHVLGICPSDAILEYYFDRFDLSPLTVVTKVRRDDSGCLFAVTDEPEGQTLESVLSRGGVDPSELKQATLLAHYAGGNVYKLELTREHSSAVVSK
jgi:hypothetical protein